MLRAPHWVPNDSLSQLVSFAPCFVTLPLYLAYIGVPPAEDPSKSFLCFGAVPQGVPHYLSI
jgi:hypothetical protein